MWVQLLLGFSFTEDSLETNMIVHTYTYTQIFTAFLEKQPFTLVLPFFLFFSI